MKRLARESAMHPNVRCAHPRLFACRFRATIKGTRIPVALRVFENQALKPEEGEGDGGFEALSASEAVQDLVSQKPANRLLRPLQAFMGPATTASKEKNKDRPTVWMVMPFHPVGSLVSMMRT